MINITLKLTPQQADALVDVLKMTASTAESLERIARHHSGRPGPPPTAWTFPLLQDLTNLLDDAIDAQQAAVDFIEPD
jgi:hypothetical protein